VLRGGPPLSHCVFDESRKASPAAGGPDGSQMPAAGLPGGAIIGAADGERTGFNHLGTAELSESLGLFVHEPSPSIMRENVVFKARAEMMRKFVRGHTVSCSSSSASAAGELIS